MRQLPPQAPKLSARAGQLQLHMIVRDATDADAHTLAVVFTDAIRATDHSHYTPVQVEAWVAGANDPAAFGRRVLVNRTFIAEHGGEPVGFVSVAPDGHVAMLYVCGSSQGRGVGGRLLTVALAAAVEAGADRAYTEASVFSLPVFARAGFSEIGVESVEVRGVRFERWLMEKPLAL